MLLMDDWLIEGMAYALSDDPSPHFSPDGRALT